MDATTRVHPETGDTRVVLDGTGLALPALVRLADATADPAVDPGALDRLGRAHDRAGRLAATGRWYGRGTGVGAHRSVLVGPDDEAAHGLRLLRSHAGGAGPLLPVRQVRAMLAVRANQLLAGGSGIHPSFVTGLTEALRLRVHPAVNAYGGVGTGDLTALAQTGLTLIGERPWLTAGEPVPPRGGTGAPDPARRPGGPAPGPDATGDPWGLPGRPPGPDAGAAPPLGGELPAPLALRPGDALALLSSNALALAQAALAGHELDVLLRATHAVAALSLAAVSGSPEAYAAPVHALRPYPGPARAAAEVRRLLDPPRAPAAGPSPETPADRAPTGTPAGGGPPAFPVQRASSGGRAGGTVPGVPAQDASSARPAGHPSPAHPAAPAPDVPPTGGRRVQDPFGFRVFPQGHGVALDACEALRRVVEVEINCPSENPVLTPDGRLHHHGGFFAAPLALALDGLNLALLQTAQLSTARLAALGRADLTGLPAFLAPGPAGSSGTMILEYTAHSALAEVRACAAPASAGHAVLSHGLEEAATFAGQAARQTERATDAYATVLACELVAAVRALRLRPVPPSIPAFVLAAAALPSGTEDRPLSGDIATAAELLPRLAEL
ncbi:aromatic amino acid lyase [Streptomyces sp. TG1A-8]|uniref:aromatic amino acid lyase n=1 Tax=Streptomyces sp. TG1A-8 TaxID=3051385 RepID=UPI00265B9BCC|nr:aromatic amino acid lyase [Streptomyces sp. TG1A-8]MDO0925159.1 aromatic amino acid lyase [Streptomyces sp. TG1A-8]